MTQREIILSAFRRGERLKCTDAFPRYGISPHSFTRVVKELRDSGVMICDVEISPRNGGTAYKEYYLPKDKENGKEQLKQVDEPCRMCGSYYRRGKKCNMCGAVTPCGTK